ncbi:MAG TPA: TIGR01212 family radical SAM protein [Rhodocyclaceae bacterium]|nr:TIGR01212 family radical SAM protein [Rhodocyclaceae bacterium]
MSQATLPAHFNKARYFAWNDWVKTAYGGRVQKVSLDAGFSCPNRDGSLGRGGCTFCNNRAFTPSYLAEAPSLSAQLETGIAFLRRRYPRTSRYLAYFQSYSNTYAPLDVLRERYEAALAHPQVAGLVIGTRPDCLPDAVLDYLAELSQHCIVELEIGIESCDDDVLVRCERGHDFACSEDAIRRAAARGLQVTGHLLLGLPGETRDTVRAGAERLAALPLAALKFHQLQIVRNTKLAVQWKRAPGSIALPGPDEYLDWVVDTLERLPTSVRVQRLGSEVPPSQRFLPNDEDWSVRASDYQSMLAQRLRERDTWQGRLTRAAG